MHQQPPMDFGQQGGGINYINPEAQIDNIVEQIDPKLIIKELNHALKGEVFNKKTKKYEQNDSKNPIVNNACRGEIISFLTPIITNNTTMANISSEKEFSHLMDAVIESINRMFIVNLERFGFVPPGKGYKEGRYENKGTPDSARMTKVTNMIYMACFFTFSRARNGMESRKLFGSLSMVDNLSGSYKEPKKKTSIFTKFLGGAPV